MRSTIKSMLNLALATSILITVGCQDSPEPDFEQGQFETETFPDLTVDELNNLETPFQNTLNSSAGRALNGDINALIAGMLELLEGATILELTEGEERGLAVLKVKLLLANKAILEVVIATENLKILEVEGHRGPFDYDIDPGGNFITLQEGLQAALDAQSGEIVRWELELEQDDEGNHRWELEVHIENDGVRYEVEIDAFTGEVIAVNEMDDSDDDEFEEEEEKDEVPQALTDAVAAMITGEILYAESRADGDEKIWKVLVETESEAEVHLIIAESTLELLYAEDEHGPFDYGFNPGEGFLNLSDVLEAVNGEFNSETYRWRFEGDVNAAGEKVYAYFIKVEDEAGKYNKVAIDAKTGDWLEHEGDGHAELPANIEEAVEAMIDAEIVHFEKKFKDTGDVWYVYVETTSGAEIKLVITDETEDLIYARDEHGPFDYDLVIGEGFLTLQDAITPVASQYEADTYYWYFERIYDSTGEEKWAFITKVITENEEFVRVSVDAQTGDWLKVEDFRTPELPTEIATAIENMIDAEIIEHYKITKDNGGQEWKVYVKTASEAQVKLIFSYETHDLIYARDEHGPFDYELTLGGNFRLLSDNLEAAAALFETNDGKATVQNWIFDIVDRDAAGAVEKWAFIIEVKSTDEKYYRVKYDAKTGDILSEEEID